MKEFKNNIKVKLSKALTISIATAMLAVPALNTVPIWASGASPAAQRVDSAIRAMASGGEQVDTSTSPTYYKKANWDNRIKDKSRWKVEDNQSLVRVSGSDPLEMNDIDYDGMFINANGRYVIRLVYKEKSQAVSAVWYRAIINFGDLDKYIDFSNSYVIGRDGETKYPFDPLKGTVGRGFDLGKASGDRTNNRKNLPINLVLKDGITLENLPKDNYIIQMRITDGDYKKVYAYAPKGTSMDYSTYTKTTSVSLLDKVNNLFIKGGLQSDSNSATNQEFFMSEFIANPDEFSDVSNRGIIRTQYMGQRAGTAATPTVGGEPIAFTQVFDANLLKYLIEEKSDDDYVAYVNVLTDGRVVSPYSKNFGIKKEQINVTKDAQGNELAYLVIGTEEFQQEVAKKNDGVKVVTIPQHDQYTMLSGFYITAIDYVVDKSKFEDTFAGRDALSGGNKTRKLNYTMMSGWTNPNLNGWAVYEKPFENDFVVQEGESFIIDAGANAKNKQIMLKVGGEQGMIRKPQGYYNGYNSGKSAVDYFDEIADGIFKIGLREGATVKSGQKLKIYMPYTSSYDGSVNFLQMHNGTKKNEGAATLTLQKDRNINMHLYTGLPRGASFKLKYTLNGQVDQKELVFTKPKKLILTTWQYEDNDQVLTGAANRSILASGGNFYIDTTKLEPGKDIVVEAYDEKGNLIADKTSSFKYIKIDHSQEAVKYLTWTDHSDKKAVLSINKSLYTPYQVLFTNDYIDNTVDDFYKDPRVLPADNGKFNTPTEQIVGYTRYDGGKVRTLYEGPQKLFGKVEAASDDYDDKGNLTADNHTNVTIKRENVFDPQFTGNEKTYRGYAYTFDLNKMLPYHSDDKTETKLTLLKDMKFVSTASDGSSLPSDFLETRVRARVLFDANGGDLKEGKKAVKIVPDNVNFYGEEGYKPSGFEGANVEDNTGDKFPEAPTLDGKTFIGWVTEEGKTALGNQAVVSTDAFNNLPKNQVFSATTPVEKHLVVYAIYTQEKAVTFDANGGAYDDGKSEKVVSTTGNSITEPNAPTKEGYTFKGWASTKNATEAEANILENVDGSKTVYAVWVKEADKNLDLNAPKNKVPVQDKTDLTEGEKDKVKDAVKEANQDKNLTNDNITVENDGKVIVNKDGKTGEIPASDTVTQKEVLNKIKPPEKPVEVKKAGSLDEGEKDKVKDAIIAANPELNLTKGDITVDNDGKVTVNKGGKVGEVAAKDTVVEESKVIKLNPPTNPVEVKDVNNLTKDEREAVAKAIKEANGDLSETAQITVDGNGNVTVTDGDKKGTLDSDQTIKPFDRTGKTLNKDIEKTQVSDLNSLTEAEKNAVREAVKAANPDLAFKDSEIQVDAKGNVKVPMGKDGSGNTVYDTIGSNQTVVADDVDTTISLKAPAKTYVKDPTSLTEEDKKAVEAAVKAANKNLPQDAKIVVADDGSVSVTSGKKYGSLDQADTVVKKLLPPKTAKDEDGTVVVGPNDERTSEIVVEYNYPNDQKQTVTAKKDPTTGLWKLDPEVDGITVDKDSGLIKIPAGMIQNKSDVKAVAKDGANTSEENTIKSEDKQAPARPELKENEDGSVTITPPKDEDTATVTIKYGGKEVTATKSGGGWTFSPNDSGLTVDQDGNIVIPAEKLSPGTNVSAKAADGNGNESSEPEITTKTQAEKIDPVVPAKTPVADPTKLKSEEKTAIEDAIKEANKNIFPERTTVTVDETGKATIKYPDGSTDTIPAASLVEKVDKTKLKEEADKNNNDAIKNSDKYKNAEQTKKDAYDTALDNAKKVLEDPNAKQEDVDKALKALKDAEEALDGTTKPANELKDPAKVAVKNPAELSADEKAAIKKAVMDANPGLTEEQIEVDKEGNVTVTKAGEDPKTIGKDKTVSTDVKAPELTEVANKSKLTLEEKTKVKDAVKKANTGLADNQIDVKNDGTVVVKKDNKETIIPASSVVKEKAQTPGAPTAPTVKANEDGTVSVTLPTDADLKSVTIKYTDPQGDKKTVTATKDGDTWEFDPADAGFTVDGSGNIVIPKDQVKPGTQVSATATNAEGKNSKPGTAKVPSLADKYAPEYTEADAQAGKPTTITAPNFKEGNKEATKPNGTTFKLGDDAPTGATIDENGKITYTPTDADAGKTITIPVVVKYSDGSTETVNVTVKVAPKTGQETGINAPDTPITVDNAKALTPEDKKAVEDAVRAKNPDLPEGAKVEVANDGTVTVKDKTGKEIGKLTPDKTVAQDANKLGVKAPEAVEVADPENVTPEEQGKIKEAIKKANPDLNLTDDDITVDNKGNVTVTKDGKSATLTPAQTIKKAGAAAKINAPVVPVTVGDKNNLTPAEKMAVEKAVRRANQNLPAGVDIVVGNDGTVTIKKGNVVLGIIPGSKTVVEEIRSGGHFYEPSPGYLNSYIPKREEPKKVEKKEELKKEEKAEPRRLEAFRWYVRGNEHGEFMPKKGITRAEVAQIFARALGYDKTVVGSNIVEFKDVKANAWYHDAVVKTAAAGIFKGSDVGTFMPEREITRAELVATIARFQKLDTKAGNTMNLPQNHWAISLVEAAYQEGWLDIYEKGLVKFDADGVITREEVVTILNRAFGRQADANYIDNNASRLYNFKDVDKSLWSYYEILTAANTYVVGDGWADHSNVDSNYEIDNVKWDMPLLDNDVVEQVKFQR